MSQCNCTDRWAPKPSNEEGQAIRVAKTDGPGLVYGSLGQWVRLPAGS